VFYFTGPGAVEVFVYRFRKECNPSVKMLRLYCKPDMLFKGITAVAHFSQHHRGPKVIHLWKVLRPVHMRKDRRQQRILLHLCIEHVNQFFNILSYIEIMFHINELIIYFCSTNPCG